MPFFLVAAENGERIVLDKAVILIGRHPDCDAVLNNSRKVSRRHCCIAQVNDAFIVRDLGSMNGVRVNGRRIEREAPLALGDEIAFGDARFILQSLDSPDAHSDRAPASPVESAADAKPAVVEVVEAKRPIDLSQKFPVPIDDEEGEEFAVEPSIVRQPGEFPAFQPHLGGPVSEENSDGDDIPILKDVEGPEESESQH